MPGGLTLTTTPSARIENNGIVIATGGDASVIHNGTIDTASDVRGGIFATSPTAASITATGPVSTGGIGAAGISAISTGGAASVTAGNVTTAGDGAAGIVATGTSAAITINGAVATSGTAVTLPAMGDPGVPAPGTPSDPGLDPADLQGPSAITFFDYFFSDNLGVPAGDFRGFIQWTVTGGSVDLVGGIGPGVFGAPPNQPNGRYVDLGGSTGDPGFFETIAAFPVLPGQTFNLTFDYRSTGGDVNTATASVGSNAFTVTSGETFFQRFSQDFGIDAIDLVRVAFQGLESDTDNSGIGIDGVLFGPALPTPGVPGAPGAPITLTADAVIATATAGAARVTNLGSVRASGFGSRGIVASGQTGVTVAGTGSVATSGDLASGIEARSPGTVSVTQGSVSTSGMMSPGIRATSTGAGAVTVAAGTVITTGMGSRGIDAFATSGPVSVTAGTVATSGTASDAIVAMTNAGSTVVNVGNVRSISRGIVANGSTTGTVNVTGAVVTTGDAITLNTGGAGTVNIANGASMTGLNGIVLNSAGGATVANAGMLGSGAGSAVLASGSAPVTITNTGTLDGRVILAGGADRVVNSGLFNARADSVFGAGADSFVNSGRLLALTGAASSTVTFAGLESFANAGLVDLRNGRAGDSLTLPGSFTGSGTSALGLDVALSGATSSADRLNVGTADGSTVILLAPTGDRTLTDGVIVVQAGAASPAEAFTLGNSIDTGLVSFGLQYDPATFAYSLVGTPDQAVFRTLAFAEGTRELWHRSADAWSGHLRELRDGRSVATGTSVWVQMHGSASRRSSDRAFTTFDVTTDADLDYTQDVFGGQAGVDFGTMDTGGGAVFGATAGYINSEQQFRGSSARLQYDVLNVGAYAAVMAGPFFANLLGKYDFVQVDGRDGDGGFGFEDDYSVYGAKLEAGLRFGSESFFAEPVATIAYIKTDLDDIGADQIRSTIAFDEDEGLRGTAGLRIGASRTRSNGQLLTVYAGGHAVHEFQGRDRIAFTSGAQTLEFQGERIGTYGQGTLGFSVVTPGGVSGFLEAHGEYGDDYRGGGGRAGLRIAF